ncbi:MAG: peptide deformylase [Candidatus Hodarchaeales archaeon]|jgi:peptide deformylase
MTVKEVLLIGNHQLREKSTTVTDFGNELQTIIQDLKDTLIHLQETKKIGRALAAPQIGYLKKVIYFGLPSKPFLMVNPNINWQSEEMFQVWDSCYSFDVAFFVEIERHRKINVEYQDYKGKKIVKEFSDDLSELVQHEIDHLEGILATDHLTDVKKIILRQEWEKRHANKI